MLAGIFLAVFYRKACSEQRRRPFWWLSCAQTLCRFQHPPVFNGDCLLSLNPGDIVLSGIFWPPHAEKQAASKTAILYEDSRIQTHGKNQHPRLLCSDSLPGLSPEEIMQLASSWLSLAEKQAGSKAAIFHDGSIVPKCMTGISTNLYWVGTACHVWTLKILFWLGSSLEFLILKSRQEARQCPLWWLSFAQTHDRY